MTIICVTRAEDYTQPFLSRMLHLRRRLDCEIIIACDGDEAYQRVFDLLPPRLLDRRSSVIHVKVKGPSLEGVLDEVIDFCNEGYILRLDDDEMCSQDMIDWLTTARYETHDHWSFTRLYHFFSPHYVLYTPELYPDLQTRLSIKSKAGGRSRLHEGSPFGFGKVAPVALRHYKFLVKSYETRRKIAARYDDYHQGFGTGPKLLGCTLPEDAYRGVAVPLHHYNGGIGEKAADIILS